MFFYLSKVLDIFLCPYTWGVIMLAAATPFHLRRVRGSRRWRRRRLYGITGLVILLVSGMSPFSNAIMYRLEHAAENTYRPDVTYDAVIVLGGFVDEEATVESGLPTFNDGVERMIMTHKLLREGRARSVIVSAATNPAYPEAGEAAVVARQLEDWGIEKERIIIEDRALNTRENAVYSQQIARARGFTRVLVVTSAFHMSRAAECFAAIGMKVDTLPVDYRAHRRSGSGAADWVPRVDGLSDMSGTLHELFGWLVYRIKGYGAKK